MVNVVFVMMVLFAEHSNLPFKQNFGWNSGNDI